MIDHSLACYYFSLRGSQQSGKSQVPREIGTCETVFSPFAGAWSQLVLPPRG
jgi:hypothetical protein